MPDRNFQCNQTLEARNTHALLVVALFHSALSISCISPYYKPHLKGRQSSLRPAHLTTSSITGVWYLLRASEDELSFPSFSDESGKPDDPLVSLFPPSAFSNTFFLFFPSLLWDPYGNSSWKALHIVSRPIPAQSMLSCEVRLYIALGLFSCLVLKTLRIESAPPLWAACSTA